jgi:hypothetical protein
MSDNVNVCAMIKVPVICADGNRIDVSVPEWMIAVDVAEYAAEIELSADGELDTLGRWPRRYVVQMPTGTVEVDVHLKYTASFVGTCVHRAAKNSGGSQESEA